jgi:hypothetical protein
VRLVQLRQIQVAGNMPIQLAWLGWGDGTRGFVLRGSTIYYLLSPDHVVLGVAGKLRELNDTQDVLLWVACEGTFW